MKGLLTTKMFTAMARDAPVAALLTALLFLMAAPSGACLPSEFDPQSLAALINGLA